jgi:hypothetical protein
MTHSIYKTQQHYNPSVLCAGQLANRVVNARFGKEIHNPLTGTLLLCWRRQITLDINTACNPNLNTLIDAIDSGQLFLHTNNLDPIEPLEQMQTMLRP